MPELLEQMYCSQQIVVPPQFPYILKRYCKAAIKTQPYDLLRWSFEYFNALAKRKPPPVKLRLEYPVYSTEGGLTRGCLKVLANQLIGMQDIPLPVLKNAWQGFCLDNYELKRVLCLCEVYLRSETVPFLHFVAVAGGLLTKSLTHTMILLCETLTKEPDGGSAAIPIKDFITMYTLLAKMDVSKDVKYRNGYREGEEPEPEEEVEEEEVEPPSTLVEDSASDDYWNDSSDLQKLTLINDHVDRTARLSLKLTRPVVGKIERSPSVERAGQIERENYLRDRKGRPIQSLEVDSFLQNLNTDKAQPQDQRKDDTKEDMRTLKEEAIVEKRLEVEIFIYDEDGQPIPLEIFGEKKVIEAHAGAEAEEEQEENQEATADKALKVAEYIADCYQIQQERIEDLENTFKDLAVIVDRAKSANYDLGMIAGRQLSTTSGEFIVQHIEKEIMDQINEQIAVLPDPDMKKKKAKPEEVNMVREILETFLEENMDIIVPEVEEVEEEEQPIPEIIQVYAVPGIGPPVDDDTYAEFIDYAMEACKVQADVFMPRNMRHFLCPPLEKYVPINYEKISKVEEVVRGGVITD